MAWVYTSSEWTSEYWVQLPVGNKPSTAEIPNVMQWQEVFELWEHRVMIAAVTTANHQT